MGRASGAARSGSEAGAANLLSLLLCASIRVICWLKLRLHSLISYPGKEEEAGEPGGTRETKGPEVLPRSLKTYVQPPLRELVTLGVGTELRSPEQNSLALGWCMQGFQPW